MNALLQLRKIASGKVAAFGAVLASAQLLGFIRSVVVARAVGPEVQGEAAIVGLVAGFFGSVLILNTAWQLVQSRSGDDDAFCSSLQGVTLVRGVCSSLVIALLGWLMVDRLGYPSLRAPICAIALVPFLESAIRLDAWKRLRLGAYRGLLVVEAAGPVGSLLGGLLCLAVTNDVWVLVWVGLGGSLGRLAASHFVASGPWLLRVHGEYLREIVQFGWPLIPAGLLFWVNSQTIPLTLLLSDHVDWLPSEGLVSLGAISVVAGVVILPLGFLSKIIQVVVVPAVSGEDRSSTQRMLRGYWGSTVMVGAALAFLGATVGPSLGELMLGPKYQVGLVAMPWLSGVLGLRLLRVFVYQAGVARGETRTQLVGNAARLSALPMTIGALAMGSGLSGLALAVFLSECVALTACGRRSGPMGESSLVFWLGGIAVCTATSLPVAVRAWT